MDFEKTRQRILKIRVQTEAILQQLTERNTQTDEQTKPFRASKTRQTEKERELADILRRHEEQQRRRQQEHRRAEEEYRRARQDNEEFHRGVDERFDALIKMMDEWIRKRRNGSNGPS